MSAANLPACPECGNRPEYAFKIDYQAGTVAG